MATHLTSTYETTLEDAEKLLEQLAHLRIAILRAEAKREAQIARAKSACEAETADDRVALAHLEARLTTYITMHAGEFTRPRMHKTPFGKFGLTTSTRCAVDDEEAVIQYAKDQGYTDLIRVVESVERQRLKARLADGQDIPGAHLATGDIAKYEIDKTVLQEMM